MNRLLNQRVYLAGAVDRVPDRGATWRASITPFLENIGIKVFNPILKSTGVGLEDDNTHLQKQNLKKSESYDELSVLMKNIRNVDLRMVDISDFLIVSLDLNTHACGTFEEIFWANRQKKTIIIHMTQGKVNAPDWLFGTIPHQMIFSTWEEIKEYLNYIDSSVSVETHNRWYFLT